MFLLSTDFFQNYPFQKNLSWTLSIRVSKTLDPDQARLYVMPDLGPNCLQNSSTDDKIRCWQAEFNNKLLITYVIKSQGKHKPVHWCSLTKVFAPHQGVHVLWT